MGKKPQSITLEGQSQTVGSEGTGKWGKRVKKKRGMGIKEGNRAEKPGEGGKWGKKEEGVVVGQERRGTK